MRNLLVIVLPLALGACANVSSLQTAKSMDKGKVRFVVGGGTYGQGSGSSLPFVEMGFRYGLFDRLEFGMKYSPLLSLGADLKLNFLRLGAFNMALGVGGAYQSLSSGGVSFSLIDLLVPGYVSIDGEWVSVYASPRYLKRMLNISAGSASVSFEAGSYAGGAGGIRFGKSAGIFFEGAYLKALGSLVKGDILQITGAFYFGSG